MKRINLFLILLFFSALFFEEKAQTDSNKIVMKWWLHCRDQSTTELYTDTLTEGKMYMVKPKQVPANFQQVQPLYDALVSSVYGFEYGSLSEDIELWVVLDDIDCSNGLYTADSTGIHFFFDMSINVLGHSGTFYLNPGNNFIFRIKKTTAFNNFLQASNINSDSALVFAYSLGNSAGLDTSGISTVGTDSTIEAIVSHFSKIVGTTRGALTGILNEKTTLPSSFSLQQNFPNPFNPTTTISFSLPVKTNVQLKVYNILGIEVANIIDGTIEAGFHSATFDASKLSSGIYFYKLIAGNFEQTLKMVLLK